MAPPQQQAFCESVKVRFPQYFSGVMALDIGLLDVNGNNQVLFDADSIYLAIDLAPCLNADVVCRAHELELPEATFDTIVSTGCLEHDRHWIKSLQNAIRMLRPGGLLLATCATTPRNAPLRTMIADEWADYYRNVDENDIRAVIDVPELFQSAEFSIGSETNDLYFFGIKHGVFEKGVNRSTHLESPLPKMLASDWRLQLRCACGALEVEKAAGQNLIIEPSSANAQLQEVQAREQNLLSKLGSMDEKLRAVKAREHDLLDQLSWMEAKLQWLQNRHLALSEELSRIYRSKSWRSTRFLRVVISEAGKVYAFGNRIRNGLGYIVRGDFDGLRSRLRSIKNDRFSQSCAVSGPPKHWGIMATPHTLFMAHLVASRLRSHGWEADIMTSEPSGFPHKMYVVICPQMFKLLPPGEKRIVYQMEQSVSSRWFTDDYIKTLDNSLALLEYSLVNVEFLAGKGVAYPRVHYVPVGADAAYMNNMAGVAKAYDVLFYGDANSSPRRRKMLAALHQHFQVRICSEIFGSDMTEEIRRARVVINLHYYENALLEMPRLQECLSLGVTVVSESAQDQADYPELSGGVTFFDQGNEQAMVDAIRRALEQPAASGAVAQAAVRGSERFAFMFDRFLVAMGILPSGKLMSDDLPLPPDISRIALSMPETISRRRIFEANRPQNCAMFDGVRSRPGWIGCGLSYSALGRHALKHRIQRLTVLEDDVLLPADFEDKMRTVQPYLDGLEGQWDVFTGMIATLHPDARVLRVENFRGIRFVTIDKMTSTVCIIYSQRAQRLLASWNPDHANDQTNTIDKYLERQTGLRVIVALPFLVGHREEVHSTLWGFQNIQYRDLIAASEQALQVMAKLALHTRSNFEGSVNDSSVPASIPPFSAGLDTFAPRDDTARDATAKNH